ncbi:Isochorismatase hydrolase [Multifurca ochricompacta]|uniref:Isochorismatase hydrolase n=1 Tax=Multifurca ochricompacta TaxID=376703 RepID=A0AAD4M1F3_9AGAM|nr:Isochorismatase hydrolase [Multifurca ochricompacta]
MASARVVKLIPGRTAFSSAMCRPNFVVRPAIYGFDALVDTGNKLLKAAKVQSFSCLGKTDDRFDLASLGPLHLGTFEKTLFSMATPEVLSLIEKHNLKSLVLLGIESHVCVLQSTLDLLERGYDVHILADGVSSCNKEEVPWALERMRQAGAQISTSESTLFQLQVESSSPKFKEFAKVIKEEKDATTRTLETLLPIRNLAKCKKCKRWT